MNRENELEVIKAIAFGMSDEQVANFADIEVEGVDSFKKEHASEIEERRRAMEEGL